MPHPLETDKEESEDESAFRQRVPKDEGLTAPDVFEVAQAGDRFAKSRMAQISRYNTADICALRNAFNPGLVTLGGGAMLNNQSWVLERIESHVKEFCFVDPPSLTLSPLGEDIGLYGALGTYRDRTKSQSVVEVANSASSTFD